MRDLFSGDPPPLPGAKLTLLLGAVATLGYKEISRKGGVAVIRVQSVPDKGLKVQTHIDWDDGAYAGLIAHAKVIQEDRLAQEYTRRRYEIITSPDDLLGMDNGQ